MPNTTHSFSKYYHPKDNIALTIKCAIFAYIINIIITLIIVIFLIFENSYTYSCTTNKCIPSFWRTLTPAWEFHWGMVQYIASIGSVIGILISAQTYISTSQLNKLSNHNLNSALFKQILDASFKSNYEILKISDINSSKFYNTVYPRSSSGDLSPSMEYKLRIQELNHSINNIDPRKLNRSIIDHCELFSSFCHQIGFETDIPTNRRVFLKAELEIIDFLNRVNSSIFQDEKIVIKERTMK